VREQGVEVFKGYGVMTTRLCPPDDTCNLEYVAAALDGTYKMWVITDGFNTSEERETYVGLHTFELSKRARSLMHYVWSCLDYCLELCRIEHGQVTVFCPFGESTSVAERA
jgi:hypothetical protein